MTIELKMLALSVALGFVQILLPIYFITKVRGTAWNMGARDEKLPDVGGIAGRLDRALKNFQETFPFFMAAVLMVSLLKLENSTSAVGAQIYFVSRVIYLPLYALGISKIRTLVWGMSCLGIVMVFSALL